MVPVIYFFIFLAITIPAFLLLREVVCWYFKINERLKIELDILAEIKKATVTDEQKFIAEKEKKNRHEKDIARWEKQRRARLGS